MAVTAGGERALQVIYAHICMSAAVRHTQPCRRSSIVL